MKYQLIWTFYFWIFISCFKIPDFKFTTISASSLHPQCMPFWHIPSFAQKGRRSPCGPKHLDVTKASFGWNNYETTCNFYVYIIYIDVFIWPTLFYLIKTRFSLLDAGHPSICSMLALPGASQSLSPEVGAQIGGGPGASLWKRQWLRQQAIHIWIIYIHIYWQWLISLLAEINPMICDWLTDIWYHISSLHPIVPEEMILNHITQSFCCGMMSKPIALPLFPVQMVSGGSTPFTSH